MNIKKIKINKGFTLVELMVATTLFTIVMLMGIGSLVVSSNSAKASQKLRIAVDNVNFAIESMSRELRTGTYFYCNEGSFTMPSPNITGCSASGGTAIAFIPQNGTEKIAYVLNNKKLQRYPGGGGSPVDLVSSDVTVETLRFYVKGSDLNDKIQPSVQIIMKGVVNIKGVDTPFVIQTLATQRSSE